MFKNNAGKRETAMKSGKGCWTEKGTERNRRETEMGRKKDRNSLCYFLSNAKGQPFRGQGWGTPKEIFRGYYQDWPQFHTSCLCLA